MRVLSTIKRIQSEHILLGVIAGVLIIAGSAFYGYSSLHRNTAIEPQKTTTASDNLGSPDTLKVTNEQTADLFKSEAEAGEDNNNADSTVSQQSVAGTQTLFVDEAAISARLCQSLLNSGKSASDSNNTMYFDAWDNWNKVYKGRYDSPEAIEDKNWYINYIKNLYQEFINSNAKLYHDTCGRGGSVTDVLYQPDYNAWQ